MANHKSAEKRFRQTVRRTKINKILLSQIKNSANEKKNEEISKSFSLYNAYLSKAVKKGLIKKRNASRKLSSLSIKLKK